MARFSFNGFKKVRRVLFAGSVGAVLCLGAAGAFSVSVMLPQKAAAQAVVAPLPDGHCPGGSHQSTGLVSQCIQDAAPTTCPAGQHASTTFAGQCVPDTPSCPAGTHIGAGLVTQCVPDGPANGGCPAGQHPSTGLVAQCVQDGTNQPAATAPPAAPAAPAAPAQAQAQKPDCAKTYCTPFDNDADSAQQSSDNGGGTGSKFIAKYITPLISALSALAGIAITISVVYGGIQYSTAGGDSGKVAAAKKRILDAIITLFIFIFFYAFLNWLIPTGIGS